MDGEGFSVPVLWDDRGEVANAFNVGIFSNFLNYQGFQFRLGDTRRSKTCLVKVVVASSTNASSLPPVPLTRSAVWGPVSTYVFLQRLSPKVKPLLPPSREIALASCFTLAFLSTDEL